MPCQDESGPVRPGRDEGAPGPPAPAPVIVSANDVPSAGTSVTRKPFPRHHGDDSDGQPDQARNVDSDGGQPSARRRRPIVTAFCQSCILRREAIDSAGARSCARAGVAPVSGPGWHGGGPRDPPRGYRYYNFEPTACPSGSGVDSATSSAKQCSQGARPANDSTKSLLPPKIEHD